MGLVELLLERGSDPAARNKEGQTPADMAARLFKTDCASLLRAREEKLALSSVATASRSGGVGLRI